MSTKGYFTEEDVDIVHLGPNVPGVLARSGWVNVGVHSLHIEIDTQGSLIVEAYPCGNEDEPLAKFYVGHKQALDAGAINSDLGAEED